MSNESAINLTPAQRHALELLRKKGARDLVLEGPTGSDEGPVTVKMPFPGLALSYDTKGKLLSEAAWKP